MSKQDEFLQNQSDKNYLVFITAAALFYRSNRRTLLRIQELRAKQDSSIMKYIATGSLYSKGKAQVPT